MNLPIGFGFLMQNIIVFVRSLFPSPLKMVREDLVILHQSGDVSNYMTVKGHAPIWRVQAVLLK